MLCLDPIFQEKMEFQIFHLRGRVVLEGLQILVPRPGSQPVPPALEARSPNYWTARKVRGNLDFPKISDFYTLVVISDFQHYTGQSRFYPMGFSEAKTFH